MGLSSTFRAYFWMCLFGFGEALSNECLECSIYRSNRRFGLACMRVEICSDAKRNVQFLCV